MKIFISSVQKEFATERKALAEYLSSAPLFAEPLYLTKYIERMGTGIRDMIRRCRTAGLSEPEIRLDGGFFVLTIRRKKPESEAQVEAHEAQVGKQPESQPESRPQSMEIRVLR